MGEPVDVVAVVICEGGRVLIQRRVEEGRLVDWWEFPGGKRKPGESWLQAAVREVREELGIDIEAGETLAMAEHQRGDRTLHLAFVAGRRLGGEPQALEGQEVVWAALDALEQYPMPEPNQAVLARLAQSA